MDRRPAGAAELSRAAGLLAALAAATLAPPGAAAEPFRTKHFEYRILGFTFSAGYRGYAPPEGRKLAVVEFEARNIDQEPRAVFIGTLHAERQGVAVRFDEPQPVPGLADKLFSELPVGARETMRFAYEVPSDLSEDSRWAWEPARAGGRRLPLPVPANP